MTDYLGKPESLTATTIFLLPAIGTGKSSLMKYGFINGYLTDKHHDVQYENVVHLLFRPDSFERFEEHVQREQLAPNLIEQYDYEGGYIVLVYSLLPKWEHIMPLFYEGKYSKFPKEYQDLFPKTKKHTNPKTGQQEDVMALQEMVFTKDQSLIDMWNREFGTDISKMGPDMEVWGKPNNKKETLDMDRIRVII